ncbi:hypothetical protein BDV95DRAFT_610667 [Massariosphaeria phaeospora]|uniref:Lysine-specific metallo-endopeptidase domain-containing protein n=1 Tax=Massariosphaeria phaeospora TaxID=100035 RepID=A0A7C8MI96_9PLEO|nr:hypothetical protein BDV95DRAFT_610667 [Massariosphaeria phaeospora]
MPTQPLLSVVLFTLHATALSYWIAPDCPIGVVQAINEVRWTAAHLVEAMQNYNPAQDTQFKDPLTWFFNIDAAANVEEFNVIEVFYHSVASLKRTDNQGASDIRIHCDNEKRYLAQPNNVEMADDDPNFKTTTFVDALNEDIVPGTALTCRGSKDTYAATSVEISERWDKHRGASSQSRRRVVIDICDLLHNRKETSTIRDLAEKPALADLRGLYVLGASYFTIMHEFAHVPRMSAFKLNRRRHEGGTDWHNGINGYYENDDTLPFNNLRLPLYMLANPDSYNFFALVFRLRMRGWEVRMVTGSLKLFYNKDLPVVEDWPSAEPEWSDHVTVGANVPQSP